MLSKIKAIIHLQLIFFFTMLSITILPFVLVRNSLPSIPNMHIYFIGLIGLIRFMLPAEIGCKKSKIKTYLVKKQIFSGQNLVDYSQLLKSSKDLFLVIIAMLIFFIGMN